MWLARFACLMGMVVLLGCGSGGSATGGSASEADDLVEEIKAALQDVADTGEMGEGFGEASSITDDLKEVDPERGESLSKAMDALEDLATPDERKTKAKEILSTL